MKRVDWLGDSLDWSGDSLKRIREFPDEAKQLVGYQLERVQAGKEATDWKPMPSVGLGVHEIRVRAGGAFRLLYVAKCADAIYVLHAFQKKTSKTAAADIELARARFAKLVRERKRR